MKRWIIGVGLVLLAMPSMAYEPLVQKNVFEIPVEDLIFFPEEVRQTATLIGADGTPVEIVEIQGTRGHLDGVLNIGQAGNRIEAFIAQ